MEAHPGIERACGQNRFDDAKIVEDFERARLYAFAARADEGPFRSLDQAACDAPAQQVNGKGQARRPCSGN